MAHRLQLHAESGSNAVDSISVDIGRAGAGLALRYVVAGDIGAIVLPRAGPSQRADRLWEHTCFEAFVRASGDPGYFELNLAPSGAWAAYRFSDYRTDMAEAEEVPPPRIETRRGEGRLELTGLVDLGAAMGLLDHLPWHVGLAVVVEEVGGTKSYWALGHPAGRPDFHHPDCFAIELPPAGQP